MIARILRILLTIVGAVVGYMMSELVFFVYGLTSVGALYPLENSVYVAIYIIVIPVCTLCFFKLSPWLLKIGHNAAQEIETSLHVVSAPDLLSGTGGLVIGLILAFLITRLLTFFDSAIQLALSVVIYIFFGYLGMQIATRRGSDIIRQAQENRQKNETRPGKKKSEDPEPKIFDTSVIVDGRIAEIMRTGFLEGKVIIPDFVLFELQHIADSSDNLKRQRGRRGLDILKKIQEDFDIEIYSTAKEKAIQEIPEVDIKLLKLAKSIGGKVVTNDYNLNKVAGITGVEVMNINDLANVLKPVVLPGEQMTAFIVKEGKEKAQGIAYLDDGTMIVVDGGKQHIGQSVNVIVTSVLQTAAGRMIFAKENE